MMNSQFWEALDRITYDDIDRLMRAEPRELQDITPVDSQMLFAARQQQRPGSWLKCDQ